MRRSGLVLAVSAVLLGGAGDGRGEVQVRREGPTVFVQGTRVALSEILDRLASATGMAIAYDGPKPRQLVTVRIDGKPEAEAVEALLEGQGINYALALDPSGLHVQSLILITDTSRSGSASGSRPGAPPATLAPEPQMEEFPAEAEPIAPVPEVPPEGGLEMPPGFPPPRRMPTPPLEPPRVPAMPNFPGTPSNPSGSF